MDDNRRSFKIKKKKNMRRKRVLKWIILPLLIILISTISYGTFLFSKAQTAMDSSYEEIDRNSIRDIAVNPDFDNISVLFIGVDDSEDRKYKSSARSDALILATFNKDQKSVKLLSIPRDSYVKIPDHGKDKITHAHSYGGPASTIETVENLLKVPVDYYVKMNFNAFVSVIDALGGVKVEVPYKIVEADSSEKKAVFLQPGMQELSGEEALALARTRKQDSDIERGKRQMEIIKAIFDKAASAKSLTKYDDIIDAVGNNMKTDLSFNDMTAFIDYVTAGPTLSIETLTIGGSDLYLPNSKGHNVYYYKLDEEDLESVQNILKSHLDLSNALVSEKENNDDDNSDNEKYSSLK